MTKVVKIPGPEHPITIEPTGARVVVIVAGIVIADSKNALTLREAAYPPVQYIPRADVNMKLLESSQHTTYCAYKGDCVYFSIPAGGQHSVDAVWSYEQPFDAVSAIEGHLAFYPDRVDAISIINT